MANIKRYLDKIRTAIYGKEVRGSLADGLEAINNETEDATEVAVNVEQRQDAVEQQFDDVLAGYSEDRPISNEETIAARTNRETGENHKTLGQRLDAENKKVNEQLAETTKSLELKKSNAEVPLSIPSYHHGDNHVVHPYVLDFPTRKYGYEYIMAFTPYSESRDAYENPSIVVSNDRYTWFVPNGLINPVIPQPAYGYHYSDPLLIDNGTELEMWYRLTNKSTSQSKLLMVKTTDLINWTQPVTVLDYGQLDTAYISPTGHIENGVYKIWYRDVAGDYVMTTSSDLANWSTPQKVDYAFGKYAELGYRSWHNEVKVIDGKYLSLVATTSNPSADLFLFESTDGINFTSVKKILEPNFVGFDNSRIYKSSLVRHGNWYYVYYSAFAKDGSNHIGLTKTPISTLDFSGMTLADKEFYGKRHGRYHRIYGLNDKESLEFPTGVKVLGDGIAEFVNQGVAAYNVQPTKTDTATFLTQGKTKKGYIDLAGIYLDSEDNDSIQGIYLDKGATYLDKQTKGLSIHPDGTYKQRYARFIVADIDLARETINALEGADFIDSLENSTYGFKVNFKNMPYGYSPFAFLSIRSSGGLRQEATNLTFTYLREIGPSSVTFGIKVSQASEHVDMSSITEGFVRMCVIY